MSAGVSRAQWEGRKVFLTGHTGFKGAWLTAWLTSMGAEVSGFSLPPQHASDLFHLAALDSRCHSIFGDIRDSEMLRSAMHEAQPEVVMHLAAQPLVRESYQRPLETFSVNVMGTMEVLSAARLSDALKAILVITTDKVYRNDGSGTAFREDDPLDGHDPYSASKAACEIATQSWAKSNLSGSQVRIATARAGNVIGGGDWAKDRLIPDAVLAFSSQQSLRIRMPHAIRPWQHVIEPLEGYLRLTQALLDDNKQLARSYNFGPSTDQCATVKEVIEIAVRCWNSTSPVVFDEADPSAPEATNLMIDSAAAQNDLGWHSQLSLEQAVEKTMNFYKLLLDPNQQTDAYELMIAQIKEFTGTINR